MSTGVTCTVFVDGRRAADGSPGEAPDAPAILEDLAVSWGRDDTMSQPPPDSCSFNVLDPAGGDSFPGVFRTGRRVDVVAHGEAFPEPSVPTFTNPGLEGPEVTWAISGGTAARSGVRVHSGAQALAVKGTAGQVPALWLSPAQFQPAGTNPDAWDGIPTTTEGQSWAGTVALWLPTGATATVDGALFSGPYSTAGAPMGKPLTVTGNGAWQVINTQWPINVSDRWVGFYIVTNPIGPTWDQLPPALTWNGVPAGLSWDDEGTLYVDDAQVTSPDVGAGKGVLVFSGRITDISASWDSGAGAPIAQVTASGFTADLDNRTVGDEPWPVETSLTRANRILALAGLPISIDIDSPIDGLLLSWRDVDSQGATGLLQGIAVSIDGVLWPAVHQSIGAYLRLEDPSLRVALLTLVNEGGVIVIKPSAPDNGWNLSACVIVRDPVTWVQDVSDVVTRAAVTWKVQGVDEDGLPTTTEATERIVNAPLEVQYGTRGISVSTELQAATDAQNVAQRLLSRASPQSWRASGLVIDDDDMASTSEAVNLMLDLLDGTSRIGAPLVIGDLPPWSPAGSNSGCYLEGGTYRYIGGRWVLELTVSVASGLGQSATWDEMGPSWTWDQWSPGISWNDLRGVSA